MRRLPRCLPRSSRLALLATLALAPAAASQPALVYPPNGSQVLTINPVFAWSEVAGVSSYTLHVRRIFTSGAGVEVITRTLASAALPCSSGVCAYKLLRQEELASNPSPPSDPFVGAPRDASFLGYEWWVSDSSGAVSSSALFAIPPLGVWDDGNGTDDGDFRYYACDLGNRYPGGRQDLYCTAEITVNAAGSPCAHGQPAAGQSGALYQGGFWNLYDDLFYRWADEYDVPAPILKAIAFGESASGMGPRFVPTVSVATGGGYNAVQACWYEPRRSYMYEPYRDWLHRTQNKSGCSGQCTGFAAHLGNRPAGTASSPFPFNLRFPSDAGVGTQQNTTIGGFTYVYGFPFSNQAAVSSGFQVIGTASPRECAAAAALTFDPASNLDWIVDTNGNRQTACTQLTHRAADATRIEADYRTEASYGLGQVYYSASIPSLRRVNSGAIPPPEQLYQVDFHIRTMAEVLGMQKRCDAMVAGAAYSGAGSSFASWNEAVWRYNGVSTYSSGVLNRYNAIVRAMRLVGSPLPPQNPTPSRWLAGMAALNSGSANGCNYRFIAAAAAYPANNASFVGVSGVPLFWHAALSPVGVPVTTILEYGIGATQPAEGSWLTVNLGSNAAPTFFLPTATAGTYWWRIRAQVSAVSHPSDPTVLVSGVSSFTVSSCPSGLAQSSARGVRAATRNVCQEQADLIPTQPFLATGVPSAGNTLIFEAAVQNDGPAPSGIFNIRWLVDGLDVGAYTSHRSVAGFTTDATDPASSFEWVAVGGTHTITFVVDVDNHVFESIESNNSASAPVTVSAPLSLVNPGIESNSSAQYGFINGWGPSGAWARHSLYPRPGNSGLGANFGYYSAGTTETVGQLLTDTFAPNTTYQFSAYLFGGGDNAGIVPFQIGYAATAGSLASFVPLGTGLVNVTGATTWQRYVGVTYASGPSGAHLGKQIIVRFGSGANGGASDIWFDNLELARR